MTQKNKGIPIPPDLVKRERALYREIAELVPGFDPVFETVVRAYVMIIVLLEDLRREKERPDLPPETRRDLENTITQFEYELRLYAEELGLTPESRVKIVRHMRRLGLRPDKSMLKRPDSSRGEE